MGRRSSQILYIKVKAGPNSDSLPVGEFQWMPGDCETEYWMQCDGRTLWISDYTQLYNVIGTMHGQGMKGFTFFIPDMDKIGQFLNEVTV